MFEAPWMSETGGRTYKMFETTSSMAINMMVQNNSAFPWVRCFKDFSLVRAMKKGNVLGVFFNIMAYHGMI